MLLRVRVTLPDRPGSLGQVARTLGVAGADIVQVVVLERVGGRAVDDFTVVWPGAARVDRLMAGLAAVPGVRVDGLWRAIGAPVSGGHDAELLAQVASSPSEGLSTLVDAVPGLLAADWAAALVVSADWPLRAGVSTPADPTGADAVILDDSSVVYTSWQAPDPLFLPEVTPLRARAMEGLDGTKYAVAPFGRAGLVLVVARTIDEELPAAAFHITEVERVAQLVKAAAVLLGDRLDLASSVETPVGGALSRHAT